MSTTTKPDPAKLTVRGIKVTTLLGPMALVAADLVPPEPAPAGDPVLDIELEGGSLTVRAKLNGKSVRKALKQIAEHGLDDVNLLLQGNLRPAPSPGQPFLLEAAGLSVTARTPKEAS
jgi:hypothetical protein